jgi:hypothetical protein
MMLELPFGSGAGKRNWPVNMAHPEVIHMTWNSPFVTAVQLHLKPTLLS